MSDEQHPNPQQPGRPPIGGEGLGLPETGIAPEVSRRVSSILDAVEREAARLRDDASEEAHRYLDYSRRRADSLVAERQQRIAELSDEIIAKAEAVVGKLDDAAPVREGFENLVRALGDAAERLSAEAERTRPDFDPPAFHDEAVQAPGPAQQQPEQRPGEQFETSYQPAAAPPPMPPPAPAPVPPAPQEFAHPARTPAPAPTPRPAPTPQEGSGQRAPTAAGGQSLDDGRLVAIQMAAAGSTRRQVREHLHQAMGISDTRGVLDEIFGPGSGEDSRVPWTAFPR